MKKFIIIVLALFALCALCSCSSLSSTEANAKSSELVMTIDNVDFVVEAANGYSYTTTVYTTTCGSVFVYANNAADFRARVRAIMNEDAALRNGGTIKVVNGEYVYN